MVCYRFICLYGNVHIGACVGGGCRESFLSSPLYFCTARVYVLISCAAHASHRKMHLHFRNTTFTYLQYANQI